MSRVMLVKDPLAGKCEARVSDHDPRWPHFYQCNRPIKVERDGHGYCGMHDPEKVAARDAKREAVYEAKRATRDLRWDIQQAEDGVVAAAEKWATARNDAALLAVVARLRALREKAP